MQHVSSVISKHPKLVVVCLLLILSLWTVYISNHWYRQWKTFYRIVDRRIVWLVRRILLGGPVYPQMQRAPEDRLHFHSGQQMQIVSDPREAAYRIASCDTVKNRKDFDHHWTKHFCCFTFASHSSFEPKFVQQWQVCSKLIAGYHCNIGVWRRDDYFINIMMIHQIFSKHKNNAVSLFMVSRP